jgi:hypothetical protein
MKRYPNDEDMLLRGGAVMESEAHAFATAKNVHGVSFAEATTSSKVTADAAEIHFGGRFLGADPPNV